MFPFIQILNRDIPLYSLCAGAGLLAAFIYYAVQCRFPKSGKVRIDTQDTLFMLIYACIFAVVGAKLLYLITSVDYYWISGASLWDNIKYWFNIIMGGGLVFYGGLIGALLGGFFYIMHYKTPTAPILDLGVSGIPLFHAFGRLGCFFAGCCYGCEYEGAFAVTFPIYNAGGAPAGVSLLPVQLIEAALNILLWVMLIFVYRRTVRNWLVSGLYLVSYGIMRFVLEFFRGDIIRGSVGELSTSQFISIFIVLAGAVLIINPKPLNSFGDRNIESYTMQIKELDRRRLEYKEWKRQKKEVRLNRKGKTR